MPRSMVHKVWMREEKAGTPGQTVSAGRTRVGEHNLSFGMKILDVLFTGQVPQKCSSQQYLLCLRPQHVKHFPDIV